LKQTPVTSGGKLQQRRSMKGTNEGDPAMLRRHPIAFAYLFALALWGALALQLRAEPAPDFSGPAPASAAVR
jgi:hypothetical protein